MKKPDLSSEKPNGAPAPQGGDESPESAVGAGNLPVELSEEAVKRLEDQLAELRDRHVRLAAEYDNFRKRVNKEKLELTDRAQATLVGRLLDVLDDLDRVEAGGQASSVDVVQHGLVLIERKLRKELEAAGLERIDPVGAAFDPSLHDAVSVIPAPEGAADHTVSATFQPGYRFKGALIRPARVQVYSTEGHA
ncbi:MAG: nucleotide exchange factor GrpE [bacterium]